MPHLLDIGYAVGLIAASPYWLVVGKARAKVMSALRQRMSRGLEAGRGPHPPTVLIHAVSLGEINATRSLVKELLDRHEGCRVVVSATTVTGHGRAVELYGGMGPRVLVGRYPLDFSGAVRRFLDHYRPDVVVLMELELWPNFLRVCGERDVPVVLVNGRLTAHSMKRYKWIGPIARRMFGALKVLCVQDEVYRQRFVEVGAVAERVEVTGTMKFDTAVLAVEPGKVEALAGAVGLEVGGVGEKVWVCGSTGPGEEALVLGVYRRVLGVVPGLRLVIVPRKPERFDEVAGLIEREGFAVVRRSKPGVVSGNGERVVLGDTMGELRNFYALATVVFVGRSLVDLGPKQHGSDMLEPAALGKPVITGKFTGNFADAMHLLRKNGGIVEVGSAEELEGEVRRLLLDSAAAGRLGEAARGTIVQGQGATARHGDWILRLLPRVKV